MSTQTLRYRSLGSAFLPRKKVDRRKEGFSKIRLSMSGRRMKQLLRTYTMRNANLYA